MTDELRASIQDLVQTRTMKVFEFFSELSSIPRPSKKEEKVQAWLQSISEKHGWPCRTDTSGNVVISVPATPGRTHEAPVILQGHQDMVCEKTPDSTHNFDTDPIQLQVDGEWLTAHKTTLGADNGIAIAIALALATDEDANHPPLEILCTVDEETGLTGAAQLDPSLLTGRCMLNLDSEDEGVLTVGCAGGTDTALELALERGSFPDTYSVFRLSVSGLRGGHSGVDIHQKRANANVLLAHTLYRLLDEGPILLSDIAGGSAHNAIPRDSRAVFATRTSYERLTAACADVSASLSRQFGTWEPNISVRIDTADPGQACVSAEQTRDIVHLLCSLPHGVQAMSPDIAGLVETSVNFATIQVEGSTLRLGLSQRSSVQEEMSLLTRRIHAIGSLGGARVTDRNSYPGWKPDLGSTILKRCQSVYRETFGREPVVEAIHAGLECGVIGAKFDSMDMVSLGPTIQSPHSPDERLHIQSVEKVYQFLVEVLAPVTH